MLWQSLQRRFSATRLLRRADDTVLLREGGRMTEWVVPRARCTFQCIDVSQVPIKRREGYVALAVKRAAPFPSPRWYAVTGRDRMMVWAWPAAAVEAGSMDTRAWSEGDRSIPEAVLRDAPRDEAGVLLAMDEGVEARLWRQGVLVASQWFPSAPTLAAWQRFLRGAGATPDIPLPDIEHPEWRSLPWANARGSRLALQDWRGARTPAAMALTLLAALLIGWPIGGGGMHAWSARAVEARIDALTNELGTVLQARDGAQRDLAEAQRLLGLRAPAGQLELIADLAGLWRERGYSVVEWDVQQGRRLRVVLNAAGADPQAIVRDAQGIVYLDRVTVEPGSSPSQLVLLATLARTTAP